jgi:hypothetical protein
LKPRIIGAVFAFYVTFTFVGCSQPETKTASQPGVEQAVNDAVDVYIYGNPLLTMDMTRKFITNFATVQGGRGPIRANHQLCTPPGRERSSLFESETIAGK